MCMLDHLPLHPPVDCTCLTNSYSAMPPPQLEDVSGEYPAHVVVSLAYTDVCVDMVAALHASCMTCVSTIVYTVCEW